MDDISNNISAPSAGTVTAVVPLFLPFLTSLILELMWINEVVSFLNMLILPRLSRFEIIDIYCLTVTWDYTGTIDVIFHSGTIVRLRIDFLIPPNYEMDVLFKRFPSLTYISPAEHPLL